MWFMDCASLGGFTAQGTAAVMQERLSSLPEQDQPAWMSGQSTPKLNNILTRVICEAVEASHIVQQYMDEERAKGRDFDEIYEEVKPYIDYISKPIEPEEVQAWGNNEEVPNDMKGDLDADSFVGVGMGGPTLARKKFVNPLVEGFSKGKHRGPAGWFDDAAGSEYTTFMHLSEESKVAAKPHAPHRRISEWPDDRSFMTGASASSRRGTSDSAVGYEESDGVDSQDITEDLILVGSVNGYSVSRAKQKFQLQKIDGHDTFQEWVLAVRIPDGGISFQITSAAGKDFWIVPAGKIMTLKSGKMHHIQVALKKGPDAERRAQHREFRVSDLAPPCVNIRVAMSMERGVRVWYTDDVAAEDAMPPARLPME